MAPWHSRQAKSGWKRVPLELRAVPASQIRGRLIAGVEEGQQRRVRLGVRAHGVVREQELGEAVVNRPPLVARGRCAKPGSTGYASA
jgi:hypothetical protein